MLSQPLAANRTTLGPTGPAGRHTFFQNALLERLTFVHPALTIALFFPLIGALVVIAHRSYRVPVPAIILAVSGGALLWSLAEYLMHRFVFHYRATTRLGRAIVFLLHSVHHEHPHDPRVSVSPGISVPLALISYAAFVAALGRPLGLPAAAGFFLGFTAYDLLHAAVHRPGPPARWLRALRAHHLRHHFGESDALYGVSSPFWDRFFGTLPCKFAREHALARDSSRLAPARVGRPPER